MASDMLRVKDTNTVPNGYFRYRDPDSKVLLKAPYYSTLKKQAREHRKANNYPIGLLWDEQFDSAVCSEQPEICFETRSENELTLPEKAVNFANAMKDWVKGGMPVSNHEEYERRRGICRTCPAFRAEKRNKILGLVSVACGKCGCTRLKLFLGTSVCPLGKW
jgi:hypothetical protein